VVLVQGGFVGVFAVRGLEGWGCGQGGEREGGGSATSKTLIWMELHQLFRTGLARPAGAAKEP